MAIALNVLHCTVWFQSLTSHKLPLLWRLHRVHKSVHRAKHDSNYGFNLPIWDSLFRNYKALPANGHDGMTIGLSPAGPTARPVWGHWLPFVSRAGQNGGLRERLLKRVEGGRPFRPAASSLRCRQFALEPLRD